jgi:hypothetical protein
MAHSFATELVELVATVRVSVGVFGLNPSILVSSKAYETLRALVIGTICYINSDTSYIVPSLTYTASLRVASVSATS